MIPWWRIAPPSGGLFCYNIKNSMQNIINKPFIIKYIASFVVVGHVLLILQNYKSVYEGIQIGLPFDVIYSNLFSFSFSFNLLGFVVFLINVILLAYLVTAIITLYKIEKNILKNSHKIGSASMLAILGSHCASCGGAFLSGIFGTSIGTILPLGGVEFGIISIIILIYSIRQINNKLHNPYVC